jgi:hypothetical protein
MIAAGCGDETAPARFLVEGQDLVTRASRLERAAYLKALELERKRGFFHCRRVKEACAQARRPAHRILDALVGLQNVLQLQHGSIIA